MYRISLFLSLSLALSLYVSLYISARGLARRLHPLALFRLDQAREHRYLPLRAAWALENAAQGRLGARKCRPRPLGRSKMPLRAASAIENATWALELEDAVRYGARRCCSRKRVSVLSYSESLWLCSLDKVHVYSRVRSSIYIYIYTHIYIYIYI